MYGLDANSTNFHKLHQKKCLKILKEKYEKKDIKKL